MENQGKYKTEQRQYHNEYYQGRSRKKNSDYSKLYFIGVVGLVLTLIVMKLFC
jgi:hypothetical protein